MLEDRTLLNSAPVALGIPDHTVPIDSPDSVIDLFAAFEDPDDADSTLTFTITANSNPGLFTATPINAATGELRLDYAPGQTGSSNLTVRATDPGGLFAETTFRAIATSVFWDGGGDGTSWDDRFNWNGDTIPGSSDNVLIDVPGSITVTSTNGATVKSLHSRESFTLGGGSFTVTAASVVMGSLTLARDTTLRAGGQDASFAATGTTTFDGASLNAQDGGRIMLRGATRYTGFDSHHSIQASGPGGLIDLSGMTTFAGSRSQPCGSCAPFQTTIQASNGAVIDLSQLPVMTGNTSILATGANSAVNLAELTSLTSVRLSVQFMGTINVPKATTMTAVDLDASSGSTLDLHTVTTYEGGDIAPRSIQAGGVGSRIDLSGLTQFLGTSGASCGICEPFRAFVQASAGGVIQFGNLATMSGLAHLSASGAGSRVELGALTTLNGVAVAVSDSGTVHLPVVTTLDTVDLTASNGGRVNLGSATTYRGGSFSPRSITASGVGSRVDLSGLTQFLGASGASCGICEPFRVSVQAGSGGVVDLSRIETMSGLAAVTASGADSRVDLSAATTLNGVSVSVRDVGVVHLPIVNRLDTVDLFASNGGRVNLGTATSYNGGNSSNRTIEARGAGSRIDLSGLTQFTGTSSASCGACEPFRATVHVSSGGLVDLSRLATMSGLSGVAASGAGSRVDLRGATTLSGVRVDVQDSGVVDMPAVTTLLTVDLFASNGGRVNLGNATTYNGGDLSSRTIRASGIGSRIDLSGLTQFTGTTGANCGSCQPFRAVVHGSWGGVVDLSRLTRMAAHSTVVASGIGGRVDLTAATTLSGVRVEVQEDGIVHAPALANLIAVDLVALNGGRVKLDAATSYDGGDLSSRIIQASGAGSQIELPALAVFNGTTGADCGICPPFVASVQAVAGGFVTLPNLTSMLGSFSVSAAGPGSHVDITALPHYRGGVDAIALTTGGAVTLGLGATTPRTAIRLAGTQSSVTMIEDLITFTGAAGGADQIAIIGNGTAAAVYRPSGTTAGDGAVAIGTGTVQFSKLELLSASRLSRLTVVTPNSQDAITLDSPSALENRVTGTSDGTTLQSIVFFDVATVTIDTASNDGVAPDDTVTVAAAGLVAKGLHSLAIETGAGADRLTVLSDRFRLPAAGPFTFHGGAGADRFVAAADTSYVLADESASVDAPLGGSVGFEAGSVEEAVLVGGTGGNRFTVSGWTRPATVEGGAGTDTIVAVHDGDLTLSNDSLSRSGLGSVSLMGIEQAELTGGGAANTISAAGFTGPVTLVGGDGNDVLTGGSGNDVLGGGPGNDILDGSAGDDTVVEAADADFQITDSSLVGVGNDSLASIERAQLAGGPSNNVLNATGFSGRVTLEGHAGDDALIAGAGPALLSGGTGNDSISGGVSDDTSLGGSGDDRIDDAVGNNVIDGGLGCDTINGVSDCRRTIAPGDILVTDADNNRVVRIDALTGDQTTISSYGTLVNPAGIAMTPSGDLIVADADAFGGAGGVIRINSATGAQTTVSSGGVFVRPWGVALAAGGDIIVADADAFGGGGAIIRVDAATGTQTTISSLGAFVDPLGVAVAANGDLLVVDANAFGGGGGVLRVNPATGFQSPVASGGHFVDPVAIVLAFTEDVFVLDRRAFGTGGIIRINQDGSQTAISSANLFVDPQGLAIANSGALFVTDNLSAGTAGRVYQVHPDTGAQTAVSSGDTLIEPIGVTIAVDVNLAADALEPNDSRAAAADLATVQGRLALSNLSVHRPGNDDWYRFDTIGNALDGHSLRIEFHNAQGDLDLELYDSGGKLLRASAGIGDREEISLAGRAAGTYFARVLGFRGATNPDYTFIVDAPQTVTPDSREPNETRAAATDLGQVQGVATLNNLSVHRPEDEDWLRFEALSDAVEGHSARLDFTGAQGNIDMELFDSAGDRLRISTGVGNREEIALAGLPAGVYFLRVFGVAGAVQPNYSVTISLPQFALADRFEPNDTVNTPVNLGSVRGRRLFDTLSIHAIANDDWFRFETVSNAVEGHLVRIDFMHSHGDLDLELYGSNKKLIQSSTGTRDREEISLAGEPAGVYYLRVRGFEGSMNPNYMLTIIGPPGASDITPDRFESNDTIVRSTDLKNAVGTVSAEGLTILPGDTDFFRFEILAAATVAHGVAIDFNNAAGDLDLALYDSDQEPLAAIRQATGSTSNTERISLEGLAAGTYFARVLAKEPAGTNQYNLRIDAPSAPAVGGLAVDDWTILVYMTASDLEPFAARDINEMEVAASRLPGSVNFAILYDQTDRASGRQQFETAGGLQPPWGDTGRAIIQPDTRTDRIATTFELLGEQNTGSAAPLVDFVNWATAVAPARHYALVLWNHGNGLWGSNFDLESNDYLTTPELVDALATINMQFDLIAFDSCYMAMAEVQHALRGFSDVVVASQEATPGSGFDYQTAFSALLKNADQVTAESLASGMVQSFQTTYLNHEHWWNTLSATRNNAFDALATALREFTDLVLSSDARPAHTDWIALAESRDAASAFFDRPDFRDLGQFMLFVSESDAAPAYRAAAAHVLDALRRTVLVQATTQRDVSGLSIYFPSPGATISPDYARDYGAFNTATRWEAFLAQFLAQDLERGKDGRDLAEPNNSRTIATNLHSVLGAGYRYPMPLTLHTAGGSVGVDQDWYRFRMEATATHATQVIATLHPRSRRSDEIRLRLFDAAHQEIGSSIGAPTRPAVVNLSGRPAGEYYVQIDAPTPSILRYALQIDAPTAPAPARDWARGNSTPDKAHELGFMAQDTILNGLNVADGLVDWFSFNTPRQTSTAPSRIRVLSTGQTLSATLLDANHNALGSVAGTQELRLEYPPGSGADYRLAVVCLANCASGTYDLHFKVAPSAVQIVESDGSTVVAENGRNDDYTMVLASEPSDDVTVTLAPDGPVDVSPRTLFFTPLNWGIPQRITVTAIDDRIANGTHVATIQQSLTSADSNYNALGVPARSVQILDDDVPGVVIAESDLSTTVAEGGGHDSYTIVLSSQPTAEVVITLGGDGQLQASLRTLTFHPANWDRPQAVTVTAVDDAVDETDTHTGLIAHTVTSSDRTYDGIAVASVRAHIGDNDTAGLTARPNAVTVTGGSGGSTYTLALDSRPVADVTVRVRPDAGLSVSPASLTFTPEQFAVPQLITVRATGASTTAAAVIVHDTSSDDLNYNRGGTAQVTVDVTASLLNEVPVVLDGAFEGAEDSTIDIALATLASDAETPVSDLVFTVDQLPRHGTFTGTGGNRLYTPARNFHGTDQLTYFVIDRGDPDPRVDGLPFDPPRVSETRTVRITVAPRNDAPSAAGAALQIPQGTPLLIDLRQYATDVETAADLLGYFIDDGPEHGMLEVTATNGVFLFTPPAGFLGTVHIGYHVADRGDPDNCGTASNECAAPLSSARGEIAIEVQDVTAPRVAAVEVVSKADRRGRRRLEHVVLHFDEVLQNGGDSAHYKLFTSPGRDKRWDLEADNVALLGGCPSGTPSAGTFCVSHATDAQGSVVTLKPSGGAVAHNGFFEIVVLASIVDRHGNPLDGNTADGAGDPYKIVVGLGTNLTFQDRDLDTATLTLAAPRGRSDSMVLLLGLDAPGLVAQELQIWDSSGTSTILSGRVKPAAAGDGRVRVPEPEVKSPATRPAITNRLAQCGCFDPAGRESLRALDALLSARKLSAAMDADDDLERERRRRR